MLDVLVALLVGLVLGVAIAYGYIRKDFLLATENSLRGEVTVWKEKYQKVLALNDELLIKLSKPAQTVTSTKVNVSLLYTVSVCCGLIKSLGHTPVIDEGAEGFAVVGWQERGVYIPVYATDGVIIEESVSKDDFIVYKSVAELIAAKSPKKQVPVTMPNDDPYM